jgi:pimeloyl-ACP methyl ester carboxylesterase
MRPTPFALVAAFVLALVPLAHAHAADRSLEVAPGVRLHLIDQGPATNAKATLVLIPGWTFDAEVWRHEIDRFSATRRVIAIDPRSQGASTITASGDTPEQRARDLHAVLATLKPGPIVLVGWSQGVQDVAAYVDQFGTGDLKGVVLVDSTVSSGAGAITRDPAAAARQFQLFDVYAKSPRDYLQGMLGAIIRKPQAPGVIDGLLDRSLRTPPAIGEAMVIDDLFGADRTGALAKFDKPTLVIASGYSPELDAQRAMAAKLLHGRFEMVEGAGHVVFIDDPDRFDALLADFMTSLD